jgi:hypothetical protein
VVPQIYKFSFRGKKHIGCFRRVIGAGLCKRRRRSYVSGIDDLLTVILGLILVSCEAWESMGVTQVTSIRDDPYLTTLSDYLLCIFILSKMRCSLEPRRSR